ncbi:MAG: division/cell wall cluster transcriptional repressor MraZ [Ignavibacteria bacterium]|nr:division/cell wall cluster transcriptional repressor MraZ [Ignavibacteria bacterium]
MFYGHAICSLDKKSRIIFPSKFRKYIRQEANNKLILSRGLDGCINVHTYDEWEKFELKLSKLNTFDPKKRYFMREAMLYVNECELDSQNRILIPPQLVKYSGLKDEVLIIGLLNKLEIWNPDFKESYNKRQELTYEDLAQQLSEELDKL